MFPAIRENPYSAATTDDVSLAAAPTHKPKPISDMP